MIAREGFALNDDLISLLSWRIETRHEHVQIRSQRAHHGDLFRLRAYDWRCEFRRCVVDVQPWCQR